MPSLSTAVLGGEGGGGEKGEAAEVDRVDGEDHEEEEVVVIFTRENRGDPLNTHDEEVVVVFTRENRGGSAQHARRATPTRSSHGPDEVEEEEEKAEEGIPLNAGCLY